MFETEKASATEIAERTALAAQVAAALTVSGFTVHQDVNQASTGLGALVWADPADDSRGGVFVQWLTDPSLSRAAAKSALKSENHSPALRQFTCVTEHMHTTLLAILNSAGFQAADAGDDMSPYLIRVEG
ncbi:hypothetical protein [Streptomyces clavuligerus]|uniref:hypothetical protein n=1 Tax=Streptomyces clavuligerus TaxID=1901 RepID=UPI00018004B5|nr:hypothetical protein [Streptomyces clavuligerus]EDY52249.1 hypothetical protein SSCG_05243 [Streptomyces clavuligerus]WDN56069.1 hypothetical protein LL058_29775 [Streptomyces clavuligerus]